MEMYFLCDKRKSQEMEVKHEFEDKVSFSAFP